jgi:hypothetical protein
MRMPGRRRVHDGPPAQRPAAEERGAFRARDLQGDDHMRDSQPHDASGPRTGPVSRLGTLVAGLAIVGLAGMTAACGSDGPSVPTPNPSVSLPTALPTSLPTALPTALPTSLPTALPTALATSIPGVGRIDAVTGSAALRGTNVPADFPVPPGASVKVGTTTGKASTVTLSGVTSDRATTFYRGALPPAGYRITSDVGFGSITHAISFTGHGVTGSIGAAGVGQSNAVAIVFTKQ